jgi:restriction system protein
MTVPDYQSFMLPILRGLADGEEHALRDVTEDVAKDAGLSDEEKRELLPSGKQEVYRNRIAWARTYLSKAGLLEPTKRGHCKITARGREVISRNPDRVDNTLLAQFPEFEEWRNPVRAEPSTGVTTIGPSQQSDLQTPEETLGSAYQRLRLDLVDAILEQLRSCSPAFFERLVVDVLVQMGYGGSRKDAGAAIGKSGDEGIDGIIKEDRLGLNTIYLQAKRWEGIVGRPEIQRFAGALQGQRARKGVFITTSSFTKEARDFAARIDTKVVLVDGVNLAELMIDHGVGVSTTTVYEVKTLDSDYFEEG